VDGQAGGNAAFGRNGPDIFSVNEDDQVVMDVGEPQQWVLGIHELDESEVKQKGKTCNDQGCFKFLSG
jgi:hypothetical protein